MLLSELISGLEDVFTIGFREREILSVTDYSGECDKESVFVCIKGARHDGSSFTGEARRLGARVFVCETMIPLSDDETLIISKNARKTLAEMSKLLYYDSFKNMKIIGVTGTKGKTTVSKFIYECLSRLGAGAILIGTLGTESFGFEIRSENQMNTTPSAPFIYRTLAYAAERGASSAVIEVSSQALMEYRVFGIPFSACVFTNFSPDHIGEHEHKDLDEYYEAKHRLFLENPDAVAVVNADDLRAEKISRGSRRAVCVSLKNEGDYKVEVVESGESYLKLNLNGIPISLSVAGRYNAVNAALAIATVSELYGAPPSLFSESLSDVRVRGRYEVYRLFGRRVIIDFAHNGESFRTVLGEARSFCRGRVIAVFGSVGDRSYNRRAELADAAERYADFSVITADNPGYESVRKICEEIYSCFRDPTRGKIVEDRGEAIMYALSHSRPSDFILLLGKGHEEYQLIKGVKVPFSEREIILSLGGKEI